MMGGGSRASKARPIDFMVSSSAASNLLISARISAGSMSLSAIKASSASAQNMPSIAIRGATISRPSAALVAHGVVAQLHRKCNVDVTFDTRRIGARAEAYDRSYTIPILCDSVGPLLHADPH